MAVPLAKTTNFLKILSPIHFTKKCNTIISYFTFSEMEIREIPEESVEPTVIADDDPREVETSLPVLMLFLLFFEE